jgi:cell division protein FtsI (penicillin-binding protein 3)
MNIKKSILLRARIAFLAVMIFAAAVLYRIVNIQMVEGKKWRSMAEKQVYRYLDVPAIRGNIYAADGSLLSTSLPFYQVLIDPTVANDELFKSEVDSLSWHLARFFGERSANEYKRKITDARLSGKKYLRLSNRSITYQEKKKLSTWPLFRAGKTKGGVIFDRIDKRFRPFNELGLRTVGFVNELKQGVGLEYSFNKELSGQQGRALFQRMSGSTWKPILDGTEVKAEEGYDVVTTLDINLQDVAQAALKKHLMEHEADFGAVVLMEVKTGHIKAMANLGKNQEGAYIEKYNYAVGHQGVTEPGSTFKLASLMALLEEKHVKLSDSIETGKGTYLFYDRKMTDAKEEGYGKITVKEAFSKSSNIGISKLVHDCFHERPERYLKYLEQFHLTQPIPFQMAADIRPYIKRPSDKSWSGITLPWMSIGYEVQLSPLQMLTFYNAIANEGKMITPIIVKELRQADQVVKSFEAQVIDRKICSDRTLQEVRKALLAVVENGTARNVKNKAYLIAGKTGTAQKVKNRRYTKSYYTSFIGYFPADAPKYSCVVIIDSPKGFRQYATDVAAPVFKEIADKIYAVDLKLHQPMVFERKPADGTFPVVRAGYYEDLNKLCHELGVSNHLKKDADWVAARPVSRAIQWSVRDAPEGLMPDVTGMNMKDALFLLENRGLIVQTQGRGRVETQSIRPGVRISSGSRVYLSFNSI